MNTIHRYLSIVLKNPTGEEVEMYSDDYDEILDEIKIRTTMRPANLNRGWMGDMTYATRKAYCYESESETEEIASATYNDVLLASVTVYNMDEGFITWEYRFLKK